MLTALFRRTLTALLSAALVAAAFPPATHADERDIRCESTRNRYRFCPADTENRDERRQNVEERAVDQRRYESYLRILESVKAGKLGL